LTKFFFVGLPTLSERKQIFKVFLQRLRPSQSSAFDLDVLSKNSDGFSGAEIEQAIIEGMHIAFNQKREFTNEDIVIGLNQIIPLSQIDPDRIKQIQSWALAGRIRLASQS